MEYLSEEIFDNWINGSRIVEMEEDDLNLQSSLMPTVTIEKAVNLNFTVLRKVVKVLNRTQQHQQQAPLWIPSAVRIIPLYSIIFLLAVIGNSLVILTLVQNKRMRTITNLFLLNLSISDLFLGVFCMPFTLVGTVLRDFVFGELMCKLLPYLQACSVSVSAWTLVAISVERFFAICYPLRSRRWQTLKHAYRSIILIWCSSLLFMSPIAVLSQLIPTSQGHKKCREIWPDDPIEYEKAYNIFLDMFLLVLPLLVLGTTYFMITKTLWQAISTERALKKQINNYCNYTRKSPVPVEVYVNCTDDGGTRSSKIPTSSVRSHSRDKEDSRTFHQLHNISQESTLIKSDSAKLQMPGLRRSNAEKSLLNKKRVIKMLFVVVLEFFICWTPLYVINTIALFDPKIIYQNLGYTAISFFQLLAYSSSCCNPITYCFMNVGFRKAFLNLFRCFRQQHEQTRRVSLSGYGGNNAMQLTQNFLPLQQTGNNQQSKCNRAQNNVNGSTATETIKILSDENGSLRHSPRCQRPQSTENIQLAER